MRNMSIHTNLHLYEGAEFLVRSRGGPNPSHWIDIIGDGGSCGIFADTPEKADALARAFVTLADRMRGLPDTEVIGIPKSTTHARADRTLEAEEYARSQATGTLAR